MARRAVLLLLAVLLGSTVALAATRDRQAPSTPTGLVQTLAARDAVAIAWAPSRDNVGVAGYRIWVDGTLHASTARTSYGASGLPCSTSWKVQVQAYDRAGNRSALSQGIMVSTAACDVPPPPPPPPPEPAPEPIPTPTGTLLELAGDVTASQLASLISAAPAGTVTVRPASGKTVSVAGGFSPPRAQVTLDGLAFTEDVLFGPGDDDGKLLNSSAHQFNIFGADEVEIRGNAFDGLGQVPNNQIWDQPAGSVPERFVIAGNTFTRFYGASLDVHSEALYIGYSADGLVEGNTFTDNGSTSHIFFTWWGNTANPATSYPRNVCVRGNTFGARHGAYYDVNFRAEIPLSSGIAIDPAQVFSTTNPEFNRSC